VQYAWRARPGPACRTSLIPWVSGRVTPGNALSPSCKFRANRLQPQMWRDLRTRHAR